MRVHTIPLLTSLFLASAAVAQSALTHHTLTIGGGTALGCQEFAPSSLLDDGITVATAQLTFSYDASTGRVTIDVANTSPVITGVGNPLIREMSFNFPQGTVTGAQLVSQTAAGGRALNLVVEVDPNLAQLPNPNRVGCFGDFNVSVKEPLPGYGIANPAADTVLVPLTNYTVGPATLKFQLSGPGLSLLTARDIAVAYSFDAPSAAKQANSALFFWCGGPSGEGSGLVAETRGDCEASVWLSTPAIIGQTTTFCFGSTPGCHGCLLGSVHAGPVTVGPITVPIGLPIGLNVGVSPFPKRPMCFPFGVPQEASLVGQSLYFTIASPGVVTPNTVVFSPVFVLTFGS